MKEKTVEKSKPMPKSRYIAIVILTFFMSLYIRFCFATSRKKITNKNRILELINHSEGFVLSTWHNRSMMQMPIFNYFGKKHKRVMAPLVSQSTDGTIAAKTLAFLGAKPVRGSSTRGGAAGLKELLRSAKMGADPAITIDGPKGPVYEVKPGVLGIAKLTGRPILPCSWFTKHYKRLNSWDRLIIPKPFTTLHIVYGNLIHVPRKCTDEELERLKIALRDDMLRINALSKEFD